MLNTIKRFLSGILDLIIIYLIVYIFYKYFPYNKVLIKTSYYYTDLRTNIASLLFIIYFGIIPYYTKGATIVEYLLKINRFREIKPEETYFLTKTENKILKLSKYFFHRIFIMILDLSLINIGIFIYIKIKEKFFKKETKN